MNRLYIFVGLLAILVLAAGFIVPQFINWGEYRAQVERAATDRIGAPVSIEGEIEFSLLPQPRLSLGQIVIGLEAAPIAEIESLRADLSLMDILGGKFNASKVVLQNPVLEFRLDAYGRFDLDLSPSDEDANANILVDTIQIVDGRLRVRDRRSLENWTLEQFDGQLTISGVSGPFALQGNGLIEGRAYNLGLNTSELAENNQMQMSAFVRPEDTAFSLTTSGVFTFDQRPQYVGEATYRVSPVRDETNAGQGDFVLVSEVELTPDKILLSSFVIQPDENRAGTRLTGAANVNLGETRSFDAVLSGGVVSLNPADAREDTSEDPYELVQLLNELPVPFFPPLPGRIGIDIAELDLRALALREVRIDAIAGENGWQIENFTGVLPGDTTLLLSGLASGQGGKLAFEGQLELNSQRLDGLARLWKRTDVDSALFNLSGGISANVSLGGDAIGLSDGVFLLDGQSHVFAGLLILEGERNALLSARLGAMSARQSAALLALLPAFGADGPFWTSFPSGSVDVAAEQADLLGVTGVGLSAQFDWNPQAIHVERFSSLDWGGAGVNLQGTLGGTLAEPEIVGGGRISLSEEASTGFIQAMLQQIDAAPEVSQWLVRALPLDMSVDVSSRDEAGEQVLSFTGLAGAGAEEASEIEATARLSEGLGNALRAPMLLEANVTGRSAEFFSNQLGLSELPFSTEAPVELTLRAQGTATNSFEVTVTAQAEQERLAYAGTLVVSDLANLRGNGVVDFSLNDMAPVFGLLGIDGFWFPASAGTASVQFSSSQRLDISELAMVASEQATTSEPAMRLGGTLNLSANNDIRQISGQLRADRISLAQILTSVAGPASTLMGDGVWAEGPIDLGAVERQTQGRIDFSAPQVTHQSSGEAAQVLAEDVEFVLSWGERETRLQNLRGVMGDGIVVGSIEICCATRASDKQFSARIGLEQVDMARLLPETVTRNLRGLVDASGRFQATGASLSEWIDSLSGEGSFKVSDLIISKFDPAAFDALATVESITELDAPTLTSLVAVALEGGDFVAPNMIGVFQVAGGAARANNLTAINERAQIFGSARLDLSDLGLGGSWVLTPTNFTDPNEIVTGASARVTAELNGTLLAPERNLDIAQMVDAIQVRALEIELELLEKLRAEQEERDRLAAEERARVQAEEDERLRQEAQRLAAEAEAQRLADEVARREAEQEALVFDFESQDPLILVPGPAPTF